MINSCFLQNIKETAFLNVIITNADIFLILLGVNLAVFSVLCNYVKAKTPYAMAWRLFSVFLLLQSVVAFAMFNGLYHYTQSITAVFFVNITVILSLCILYTAVRRAFAVYHNEQFKYGGYIALSSILMLAGFYNPLATVVRIILTLICLVGALSILYLAGKGCKKPKVEYILFGLWLTLDLTLLDLFMLFNTFPNQAASTLVLPEFLFLKYMVMALATFLISAYYWIYFINSKKIYIDSENEKNNIDCIVIVFLFLIQFTGVIFIDRITDSGNSFLQNSLVNQGKIASVKLDEINWNAFKGNKSDMSNPQYTYLKDYLTDINNLSPEFVSPVIFIKRNQKIITEVCTGKSDCKNKFAFAKNHQFLEKVYKEKKIITAWPYIHGNKVSFSTLIPIINEKTNDVDAVLLLNVCTKYWLKYTMQRRGLSASITVLIYLISVALLFLRQKFKENSLMLKVGANRLRDAQSIAKIGNFEYLIYEDTFICSDEVYNIHESSKDKSNFEDYFTTMLLEVNEEEDLNSFNTKVKEGIRERMEQEFEYKIITAKGHIKDLYMKIVPKYNHLGKIYSLVGTIQDVTARKQTESALIKARNAAQQASQAKSMFLANMSHEIRTPMNAIMGYSQLILDSEYLDEGVKEKVGIINKSGNHLLSIINNILEMSKIESGHKEINITPVDMKSFVYDMKYIFAVKLEGKDIDFKIEYNNIPDIIFTDEDKFRRIITNLLANAVKFTDSGEIVWRMNFVKESKELLIEVKDTGYGISKEALSKIFKPFEQSEAGTRYGGTGLGLSITYSLVELLGGTISVESILKEGTTFDVKIPIEQYSQKEESGTQTTKRISGLTENSIKPKILVADDSSENREIMDAVLTNAGFKVITAKDGADALNAINLERPDLIFMDIRMPVMDGLEASRIIKNDPALKSIPIVAVSAGAFIEEKHQVFEAGIDNYIVKPFKAAEVYELIAEYLDVEYVYK